MRCTCPGALCWAYGDAPTEYGVPFLHQEVHYMCRCTDGNSIGMQPCAASCVWGRGQIKNRLLSAACSKRKTPRRTRLQTYSLHTRRVKKTECASCTKMWKGGAAILEILSRSLSIQNAIRRPARALRALYKGSLVTAHSPYSERRSGRSWRAGNMHRPIRPRKNAEGWCDGEANVKHLSRAAVGRRR